MHVKAARAGSASKGGGVSLREPGEPGARVSQNPSGAKNQLRRGRLAGQEGTGDGVGQSRIRPRAILRNTQRQLVRRNYSIAESPERQIKAAKPSLTTPAWSAYRTICCSCRERGMSWPLG